MADDDQSSSIPSMVDGLTRAQRSTILGILEEKFEKDFYGYIMYKNYTFRYGKKKSVPTAIDQVDPNITLVPPTYLYRLLDDPLLQYLTLWEYVEEEDEEYFSEEPTWLMPVIPIVLVNGGIGIKCNPWDVITYLRGRLTGQHKSVPIRPWMDGGGIREKTETSLGILKADAVYGKDKDAFTEALSLMPPPDDDQMKKAPARQEEEEGFHNNLLESTTDLDVFLLDSEDGKNKYHSVKQILDDFFTLGLKSYEKQKSAMVNVVSKAVAQLEEECSDEYDEEKLVLDYDLEDVVIYAAGVKNHFCSPEFPMEDIYHGGFQGSNWWLIQASLDDYMDLVSAGELWLKDLNDLEEQLNKQYGKEAEGRTPPVSDSENKTTKKMKRKRGRYQEPPESD